MSKILRIHAKKKAETSAQDDFLQNLQRGLSTQKNEIPAEFPVIDEPSVVEETIPVSEEVKPFSEPKPMESQEEEIPSELPEEQFSIPFEEPLEKIEPKMEKEGRFASEIQYIQENFHIVNARIDSLNFQMINLLERVKNMALNLDLLKEEVTRAKTVQTSAVELIKKVVAELEAVSAELAARESEPPIDTSAIDALASDLKESTDVLAAAVADSVDVKPTHSVVLNADNPEKATVEVVLPEVLPEVVEATVEPLAEGVDLASPEPQARIVVDEASDVVVDTVAATEPEVVADPATNLATPEGEIATAVVETAEGEANVTVAVDPATPVTEVVEAVKEAYDATDEVTAVPVQ